MKEQIKHTKMFMYENYGVWYGYKDTDILHK